jgi:myosin heavy subunit
MLSEKGEQIKRMLKQGKTWDRITKELHVGLSIISKVNDAITRSEVFGMLERNCTLHEVALKVDIPSDKVRKYQLEYLELKREYELVCLLKDKDISNLVPIAREMKGRGLTPEQMQTCLQLTTSIRQLEDTRRDLSDSICLERKKYAQLCEKRSMTENQLDKLMKERGRLLEETGILESSLKVYRLAIEKLRNSKEITTLQEIILNIATSLLEDRKILLAVAASTISRTIAAIPQSLALFSDPAARETLASFFLDPGLPGNEIWISKIANSIFEESIAVLMNGILLGTVDTLGDKKFETEFDEVKAEMGQFMILCKHHSLLSGMFEN